MLSANRADLARAGSVPGETGLLPVRAKPVEAQGSKPGRTNLLKFRKHVNMRNSKNSYSSPHISNTVVDHIELSTHRTVH